MKRNHFLFCLLTVLTVYFFRQIPIKENFQGTKYEEYALDIEGIIFHIILVVASLLTARKLQVLIKGGFVGTHYKNLWLLLIPLAFPGVLMFNDFSIDGASATLIIVSFLATFLGALMEETVFRGLVLGYLRSKNYSDHKAVLLSALFFSLAHLVNLKHAPLLNVMLQLVYAFYMGLLFGVLLIKVNNVWLLGLAHGLLNFGADFESTVPAQVADASLQAPTFWQYPGQLVGVIIMFSPILLIYWLTFKYAKTPVRPTS